MHPVIARFLDVSKAVDALDKTARGETLDAQESAFVAAAKADERAVKLIRGAVGKKSPPVEAQQAQIAVATRAACRLLGTDPVLGPKLHKAVLALKAEGASEEEADDLIATAVLEEAFGYSGEPDELDADFLSETLDGLVSLAQVTPDVVDELIETFVRAAPAEKTLRTKVAEALLEAAWSEGPTPVTPEHLDDALDALGVADKAVVPAVVAFLTLLAKRDLVGPERLTRLVAIAQSASGDDDDD